MFRHVDTGAGANDAEGNLGFEEFMDVLIIISMGWAEVGNPQGLVLDETGEKVITLTLTLIGLVLDETGEKVIGAFFIFYILTITITLTLGAFFIFDIKHRQQASMYEASNPNPNPANLEGGCSFRRGKARGRFRNDRTVPLQALPCDGSITWPSKDGSCKELPDIHLRD